MTDRSLLETYAVSGDPAAFAELVRRHGPLVEGTARRTAGPDAEDVSQAVFILFSQKAGTLAHRENIAGWLYETTVLCARNARRARLRQHRRLAAWFQETAMQKPLAAGDREWEAVLDDALAQLPARERAVVLLRYIEGLSLVETAESLATTAPAVAKRSRLGLQRLRRFFRKRGFTLNEQDATGVMAMQGIPLSAERLAALASRPVRPGSGAAALAQATDRAMWLIKAKTAASVVIAGIALAGAVAATVIALRPAPPPPSTDAAITPPSTMPAPATIATQEDAFARAARDFLQALRDQNVAGIAVHLVASSPAMAETNAKNILTAIRLGPYVQHPERLTQQRSTFKEFDEYACIVDGGVVVDAPLEADLDHLVIRLALQTDGEFRVTSAALGRGYMARPEGAEPLDPRRFRKALAAWEDWTGELRKVRAQASTSPPRGPMTAALRSCRDGLPGLCNALEKTDFPVPPAFLPGLTKRLDELAAKSEAGDLAEVEQALQGSTGTLPVLLGQGEWFRALAAAEAADEKLPPVEPRPETVDPELSIALDDGRAQRIPGPLQVPPWLKRTAAYALWQHTGGATMLETTDDRVFRYTVWLESAPASDGQPASGFASIHQYRPDHTLAAITNRRDDVARDWQVLDAAGKRYLWRVQIQTRESSVPGAGVRPLRIQHFDADGSQRAWSFDEAGRFQQEVLLDPAGVIKDGE